MAPRSRIHPRRERITEINTASVAIGQPPDPSIQQTTEGLESTKLGTIVVNEETMQTKILGVYAGGDVVPDAQRSSAPWKLG